MVSGTRCPYKSVFESEMVKRAAAAKGPMTYASSVSVIVKVMGLEVDTWALRQEK